MTITVDKRVYHVRDWRAARHMLAAIAYVTSLPVRAEVHTRGRCITLRYVRRWDEWVKEGA